jgi:tRNA1(Val) A37 N6-methylase TrmN6
MPYTEGTVFIAMASEWGFYCNRIIKVKGTPKGEVIRLIMKFEKIKRPLYEKFITIEAGVRHQYTKEYKEVTADFYLDK